MALHVASPEPRQSEEEQRPYIKAYIEKIKLCFARDELTSPYYYQLVDYIRSDGTSTAPIVPTPIVTQIRRLHDTFTPSREGKCWGFDTPFASMASSQDPRIIVVEGLPSPACVAFLGDKFHIQPEFWLENLGLSKQDRPQGSFYETPSLPSSRDNIAHVRIPCLGRRAGGSDPTRTDTEQRRHVERKRKLWDEKMFQDRHYGSTRLRRMHVHDSQHFSIEQNISFCVSSNDSNSWTGLFMIDQGHEVPEMEQAPWWDYFRSGQPPHFLPILSYSQSPSDYNFPRPQSRYPDSSLHAFNPRDHLQLVSEHDVSLLRSSPFFALAGVLTRAAAAWNQLLNFIEADITSCRLDMTSGPEALGLALEQMRSNLNLLARAEQSLKSNVLLIEKRGCRSWPGSDDSKTQSALNEKVSKLTADHWFLCDRCHGLTQQCEANSKTLSDSVGLIETRKSMEQSIQVNRLTTLAILFAPLSFISSVFGMNVDQLKNDPPIWIFFAIAAPVCLLTLLVLRWWQPQDKGLYKDSKAPIESFVSQVTDWKDRVKSILHNMQAN